LKFARSAVGRARHCGVGVAVGMSSVEVFAGCGYDLGAAPERCP
jgi:hypothetical protein